MFMYVLLITLGKKIILKTGLSVVFKISSVDRIGV